MTLECEIRLSSKNSVRRCHIVYTIETGRAVQGQDLQSPVGCC